MISKLATIFNFKIYFTHLKYIYHFSFLANDFLFGRFLNISFCGFNRPRAERVLTIFENYFFVVVSIRSKWKMCEKNRSKIHYHHETRSLIGLVRTFRSHLVILSASSCYCSFLLFAFVSTHRSFLLDHIFFVF